MEKLFHDHLGRIMKSMKNEWWKIKLEEAEILFETLLELEGVKILGRNPNGATYPMELRKDQKSLYRLFYILEKWYKSKDPKVHTENPEPPMIYIINEENEPRYHQSKPIKP